VTTPIAMHHFLIGLLPDGVYLPPMQVRYMKHRVCFHGAPVRKRSASVWSGSSWKLITWHAGSARHLRAHSHTSTSVFSCWRSAVLLQIVYACVSASPHWLVGGRTPPPDDDDITTAGASRNCCGSHWLPQPGLSRTNTLAACPAAQRQQTSSSPESARMVLWGGSASEEGDTDRGRWRWRWHVAVGGDGVAVGGDGVAAAWRRCQLHTEWRPRS
jgi:hypothetical protein